MPSLAAVSRITASFPSRTGIAIFWSTMSRAARMMESCSPSGNTMRFGFSVRALRMTKCMTLRDGPSIRSSCSR